MRICQALILPHFQRGGHGLELYQLIHKLALQRDHVVELTVEDPAPGFTALRLKADALYALSHRVFHGASPPIDVTQDRTLTEAQRVTKLTLSQVRKCACFWAWRVPTLCLVQVKLCAMVWLFAGLEPQDEDAVKRYRLMCKKHFFQSQGESLGHLKIEERKEALAAIYNVQVIQFKELLAKLNGKVPSVLG